MRRGIAAPVGRRTDLPGGSDRQPRARLRLATRPLARSSRCADDQASRYGSQTAGAAAVAGLPKHWGSVRAVPARVAGTVGRRDGGRRSYREVFTACPGGSCRYGPHRECSTDHGYLTGWPGSREQSRLGRRPARRAPGRLWRAAFRIHVGEDLLSPPADSPLRR